MDYKEIRPLIEKYFEGTTSLREEKVLRSYFNGPNVAENLAKYQPIFQYWEDQQKIELDATFDDKLLAILEANDAPKAIIRPLNTWLLRIAAVVVLALGVWWLMPENTPPANSAGIDWSKYEPETPEEALKVLQTALAKTSTKLNKGASVAAGEVTKISKIGKYIK